MRNSIYDYIPTLNNIDRLKNYYYNQKRNKYIKKRVKYFCIGNNKTGTTSLEKAFNELEFIVGNQREAEKLSDCYFNGDYRKILDYCKSAEVFQDVPFSWPNTFKYLDKHFPNSKFILTIRDSSDQWYNSVIKFHSKLFGNGNLPTWEDLKNAEYVKKGWMYNIWKNIFQLSDDNNPYDKEILVKQYEKHNADVIEYFKDRKNDLLVINVGDKNAYQEFCSFIGVKSKRKAFPWENKT